MFMYVNNKRTNSAGNGERRKRRRRLRHAFATPAVTGIPLLLADDFADAFGDETSCRCFDGRDNKRCKKGELGFRSLGGKSEVKMWRRAKTTKDVLRLKQLPTSDPKESWLVVSMIDVSKIVFREIWRQLFSFQPPGDDLLVERGRAS
jgi:hypothetical protein